MLQYSIHFCGFLLLVGLQMYYKGHGEVKVDIMLLLVAKNC
jgi:hypothetical protein